MIVNNGKLDVVVLDDLKLVRINLGGELVAEDMNMGLCNARSIPEIRSYSCLYDFRNCIMPKNFFDLCDSPRISQKTQVSGCETVKVALLANQDASYERLKVYETMPRNTEFNSKVFTSEKEAIAWLINHKSDQGETHFDS